MIVFPKDDDGMYVGCSTAVKHSAMCWTQPGVRGILTDDTDPVTPRPATSYTSHQ